MKVENDVCAVFSTVALSRVETGWTCPGLFVFLHATLHSLGWPWCRFLSARRSWPGSPSLIHQPLLLRTCLSSNTELSARVAVPPCLMCVAFVYVGICVRSEYDKMSDNHFKDFINEHDFSFQVTKRIFTRCRITFHSVPVVASISVRKIS